MLYGVRFDFVHHTDREMSSPDTKIGGLTRTLKDLFAGAAGGVAQVLLGQWIAVCLIANDGATRWTAPVLNDEFFSSLDCGTMSSICDHIMGV